MISRLKRIHVGNLNTGQYVERIELHTDLTPTLWGRYIKRVDDINQLANQCRYVWIDPLRDGDSTTGCPKWQLATNY